MVLDFELACPVSIEPNSHHQYKYTRNVLKLNVDRNLKQINN